MVATIEYMMDTRDDWEGEIVEEAKREIKKVEREEAEKRRKLEEEQEKLKAAHARCEEDKESLQ